LEIPYKFLPHVRKTLENDLKMGYSGYSGIRIYLYKKKV